MPDPSPPNPVLRTSMPVGKIFSRSLCWKMLQFATSFLLNILLTRIFQSVISAEFYALVYLWSLGISFFTLGLDISLSYYLSRKQLSPAMARRIIFFIVLLALLVCLSLIYLFYQPSRYPHLDLTRLLLYSGFNIAGGLLTALSGTLFTAYGQNYLPGKAAFFINVILAALCLALQYLYTDAALVENLFGVYFLFSFLQGVFLFLLSIRLYPAGSHRPAGAQPARLADILRFSSSAFIINFIFFTGARLTLYLLPYRVPPAARGNYIQAYKIVEYMGLIVSVLYYPFIALVAGEGKEKMKDTVLFLVRISNTLVLLSGILILSTGWWLFPLIFGKSFDPMYGIFMGFLPGLFAVCSSTFFTAYFFGSGQLKVNFISACIQFGGTLLFFFLFVKDGHAIGAALAFSLAVWLSLAYECRVFAASVSFSLWDLLLLRPADRTRIRAFLRGQ